MNYYNDFDKKACAWLRELIAAGHLPPGHVDERSILEIKAEELRGYDQCHFFAGVGFWSLALQWAGLGTTPGIWTGSCPCQPFSCAGAGKGTADERHLWPVFRDLIVACRPAVVFGEQVASAAVVGKVGRGAEAPAVPVWLDGVRADVEAAGYAFGAAVVGAHSVGAPHIRQRLYWVADNGTYNAASSRCDGSELGTEGDSRNNPRVCLLGEGIGACRPPVATCGGQRADRGAPGQPGHAEQLQQTGGAPHAGGEGLEEQWRGWNEPEGQPEASGVGDPWGDYRVHRYLDGKDRRIPTEPRLFPLADDRHPYHRGRVGLLRGAGNGIIPALAAEFIAAWKECQTDVKTPA
jgi:DNA (cytosine-5)-methyltransferase 1